MSIKLDLDSPSDEITFDNVANIPTPDGKGIAIPFTFKYRDKLEVAAFFDAYTTRDREAKEAAKARLAAAAKPAEGEAAAEAAAAKSLVEIAAESTQRDVATTFEFATGWDVEGRPFNAEQLTKLYTKYPGGAVALLMQYYSFLTEGRLGNSGK
jgi:hypothetical protein